MLCNNVILSALQSQIGTATFLILKHSIIVCLLVLCLCVCFLYLDKKKKQDKSSHLNLNYFILNERTSFFTVLMTHARVAMESWTLFSSLFSWALNTTRCPSFVITIICHTDLVWSFSTLHAVIRSPLVDLPQRYENSSYSLSFSFAAQVLDTQTCQS